jgi:hypothetical protein
MKAEDYVACKHVGMKEGLVVGVPFLGEQVLA